MGSFGAFAGCVPELGVRWSGDRATRADTSAAKLDNKAAVPVGVSGVTKSPGSSVLARSGGGAEGLDQQEQAVLGADGEDGVVQGSIQELLVAQ